MLKERVQALLFHDNLRLVREEDGVTIERHPQLSVAELPLCVRHEHCGCSYAWRREEEGWLNTTLNIMFLLHTVV